LQVVVGVDWIICSSCEMRGDAGAGAPLLIRGACSHYSIAPHASSSELNTATCLENRVHKSRWSTTCSNSAKGPWQWEWVIW
jgi:hypothetical protein